MSLLLNPYTVPILRIFLICTIGVFVNSCTKSDTQPGTGTRLQKIAINRYDSLGFIFFKYDQDNRLTKLIVSHDKFGINGITTTLAYDSEGRLSTFTHSYAADSDTLKYYNDGAKIKKTGASLMGSSHLYSFDARQRLISDSVLAGDGSGISYATFSYDANDNLVEWNVYNYFPWVNSWAHFGNTFFSYDNRKSPLAELGQLLYMIRGDYEWVGKNNVTQTKFWTHTGPTVFTYEHTADGFPKKVVGRRNNEVVVTFEYYYD